MKSPIKNFSLLILTLLAVSLSSCTNPNEYRHYRLDALPQVVKEWNIKLWTRGYRGGYRRDRWEFLQDDIHQLQTNDGGRELLRSLLDNDDAEIRYNTAMLIDYDKQVEISDDLIPDLINAYIRVIQDGPADLRALACWRLSGYISRDIWYRNENNDWVNKRLYVAQSLQNEIFNALLAAISDEDEHVRDTAMHTILAFDSRNLEIIEKISPFLESEDDAIRWSTAIILAQIAPEMVPEMVPVLMEVIDSNERLRERGQAIQALGNLGPAGASAVPSLLHVIRNDEHRLKLEAAEAIANISPPADTVVPELIEMLKNDYYAIRLSAAVALGGLGAKSVDALPILKKMLEDPVEPVKEVRGKIREAIELIENDMNENPDDGE